MLVLSRKVGEAIRIGSEIDIVVLSTTNGRVKIGIDAPRYISVRRVELERAPEHEQKEAVAVDQGAGEVVLAGG